MQIDDNSSSSDDEMQSERHKEVFESKYPSTKGLHEMFCSATDSCASPFRASWVNNGIMKTRVSFLKDQADND